MKKTIYYRVLSSLILIPLSLFFILQGNIYFNLFLLVTCLITLKEWIYINYKKNFFITGFIFIIFSFLNAYWLRNNNDGLLLFIIVVIICVGSDFGGYIFGNIFKGPKLTKISPNKTYSGVIGAFFCSFMFVYLLLINFSIFFNNIFFFNFKLLLIIFLTSSISQIGDLIISYFKRRSNIKDTGSFIPGHGGILDRIDGLIFAIPSFYFLVSLIKL